MIFTKFVPITKIDAARREVYGVVTSETPDKDGEICDYASTVPHYQAWSAEFEKATEGKSKGNVREMHTHSAVGKVAELVCDDIAKTIAVRARIVDDEAWQKCQEGVYTGFSHGGEYVGEPRAEGAFKRYTAKPTEISLVDNPCNPDAHFEYVKADGSVELRKFAADQRRSSQISEDQRQSAAKREVSDKERAELADKGHAMPDGSYPIANVEDLKNAIRAYGRAKDPEAVKRHIIRRAKELGRAELLPADWEGSTKKEDAAATVLPGGIAKSGARHSKETLETLRQMKQSHDEHHAAHMEHHAAWIEHHAEMEKCFGKLIGPAERDPAESDLAGRDAEKVTKENPPTLSNPPKPKEGLGGAPMELATLASENGSLRKRLGKTEEALRRANEAIQKLLAEPRSRRAVAKEVPPENSAAGENQPVVKPSPTGDKNVLKACLAQPL